MQGELRCEEISGVRYGWRAGSRECAQTTRAWSTATDDPGLHNSPGALVTSRNPCVCVFAGSRSNRIRQDRGRRRVRARVTESNVEQGTHHHRTGVVSGHFGRISNLRSHTALYVPMSSPLPVSDAPLWCTDLSSSGDSGRLSCTDDGLGLQVLEVVQRSRSRLHEQYTTQKEESRKEKKRKEKACQSTPRSNEGEQTAPTSPP